MTVFSTIDFQGDTSMDEDSNMPDVTTALYQFVNPRYTDKRYARPQGIQLPDQAIPSGLVTPSPSTAGPESRRPSLAIPEKWSNRNSGPSSISSSFGSSPGGCVTPVSTQSRRRSVAYSEAQQYYFPAASPSLAARPRASRDTPGQDEYPLCQPIIPDCQIGYPGVTPYLSEDSVPCNPEQEHLIDWQAHQTDTCTLSAYGQSFNLNTSASLSMDLVADFSSSMASRINELAQPCTNGMPSSTFGDLIGAQGTIDQTSPVCTLGPAFEFEEDPYASDCDSVYEDNLSTAATFGGRCSRDDPIVQRKRKARRNHNVDEYLSSHETAPTSSYSSPPSIFVDRTPKRSSAERLKGRQGDRKGRQNRLGDHKNKRNQCQHCPIEWNEHTKQWKSKFSFERQEHLSRHVKSLHNPTPFFCKVVGCHAHKDYKGEKVKPRPGIQSRHDNLLPHYRTHFKYGINEKSGKNKRLSMKESLAIGLRNEDERWDWFLAGRMSIDHPDGPRDFHNSWKMMGYSILETQNTRIKTLFPEWEGPAEETLERHDARWKALRGGKMTYELAMSRGLDMPETEAQGLLGVTMMETEQMGIKNLDGRWTMLLSCCMTMEDAKKLGVEDLNRATIAAQVKRRR